MGTPPFLLKVQITVAGVHPNEACNVLAMSLYVPLTEALQAANTLGTEGGVLILRVYILERCWKKVWKVW